MLLNFEATVAALAESVIRERCSGTWTGGIDDHAPVARFVLASCARMPDYLRFPFRCLTLIFDFWAVPFGGRPFHSLPHEERCRQIRAWSRSGLGFRRDLIRFYQTLAVFAWYGKLYGRDYVHVLAG